MACLRIVISRKSAAHLGAEVIFTPHLGNFPRGILETITCRLKAGVTHAQVADVLQKAYGDKPLVRLYDKGVPALKNIVGLPFLRYWFLPSRANI
ncbi:N-acetyl-gamma-glutamyl-phosphate reductase [Salmonella enterica subsp. enterica serovar Sanjuan]|uniref:N-acetyl-gamma-glutamyl-phosphate reductase n=1 Tax=Salmonella enterica subsp. enterica serovar Sanjuan TaxID=1160765 RepID=A0A3S4H3E1_SALET|nr:N-acetyl-gamma-glutamyl-phosphate reductase [Salmonella enterica subsp. enterica serovar Sanjuan]